MSSRPQDLVVPNPPDLDIGPTLARVTDSIGTLLLGKEQQIQLAVACLLARGHLLIEDIPGVGKTTLAHALARVLGLRFSRIQFTSDLLPTDILGVSMLDRQRESFVFHPGPIFSELVLADEINRASPKSQSALLEAMQERQVSIDGTTRPLPDPFFVIATQNPSEQIGTFELPESQLDRFLMRIQLGYPPVAAERALLTQPSRSDLLQRAPPVLDNSGVLALQSAAHNVHVSAALRDYIIALVQHSRQADAFLLGLSPRAGLALRSSAQAWALLCGRDHVLPEDVQSVLGAVVNHRLNAGDSAGSTATPAEVLCNAVAIP